MRGIQIGNKHTGNDWDLVLTRIENNLPDVKTVYVDVPFMNGAIDLTEAFSQDVVYENRKLSFEFDMLVHWEQRQLLIEHIGSHVHGQRRMIQLPDDFEHYYIGRLNINQYKTDKTVGKLVIEALCEPYRYKKDKTIITRTLSTSALTINCHNSRKRVIPTLTVSAETTVKFQEKNYVLGAGTHTLTNIIFTEGVHVIEASGTNGATIKIEYQEGVL